MPTNFIPRPFKSLETASDSSELTFPVSQIVFPSVQCQRYAERYALGLGISPQSLYRYMKNVLEANAWALKLEKEDGKSRD